MLTQPHSVTIASADGLPITISTGKLARQADGAALVQCGKCFILATVCASNEPRPGQSFFPLTIDYQEKFASAGRIPGSFFRREGRITDPEILVSRLIDRALRPLFPEDYLCDVQVMVTLISSDEEVMPDALACLAASAALAVSDVPVTEVISEVRVSRIAGAMIINPTRSQMAKSDMDFIVAATDRNIMMVEGEAKECSEEDLVQVIETGKAAIQIQIAAQRELRAKAGVTGVRSYTAPYRNEELNTKIAELGREKMHEIANSFAPKNERSAAFKALKVEIVEALGELSPEDAALVGLYFGDLQYYVVRDMMLDKNVRLDGRTPSTVRPIDCEVNMLPSPHGCALFTRGETQSLTTVTLGTPLDELLVESAQVSSHTRFILHYNFPPFSTGETKPLRGPGRREVGHGNLAMRSLKQMMPGAEYPYTVRVVSDILESNGSSSMATVCAGSMALMDAGVPLVKPVSGVAMGLVTRPADGKYVILTDILGDEDHLGDMDFKVTGTRDGICGVQMDIKIDGLSMDVMREALKQALAGRLHILDKMDEAITAGRAEVKAHTPRMVKIFIDKEFIGAVIGPQGKVVQEIQKVTNTTVTIEEKNNMGEVSVFGANKEGVERAENWIKGITAVPTVGDVYEASVKSIMPYGAFVEFLPGKQGLLHISEVSWQRLDNLEGVLNEGDLIKVKLTGTDPKTGKFKLSRKALMPKPE